MFNSEKMVLGLVTFLLLLFSLLNCDAVAHLRHQHHRSRNSSHRSRRSSRLNLESNWPLKRVAEVPGDILIGGLHMVHEREDQLICGPVMPQGGLQAAEVMLYTIDKVNQLGIMPNGVTLGAHILDDCDKDTYGLQQAVDFIKGNTKIFS